MISWETKGQDICCHFWFWCYPQEDLIYAYKENVIFFFACVTGRCAQWKEMDYKQLLDLRPLSYLRIFSSTVSYPLKQDWGAQCLIGFVQIFSTPCHNHTTCFKLCDHRSEAESADVPQCQASCREPSVSNLGVEGGKGVGESMGRVGRIGRMVGLLEGS